MFLRNLFIGLRNAISFRALPRGSSVVFMGRGPMYVDMNEVRGRKVRRSVGVTRYRNSWLWRAAVPAVQPDLIMDVGANYGEIALCSNYPSGSRVLLVEANSRLASLLENSIKGRKQSSTAWKVVHAAASDYEGEAEFLVDESSSGSSRLSALADATQKGRMEKVRVVRLDELPEVRSARRVLFKIDVEGAEIGALNGMRQCLDRSESFLGLIELSEKNLKGAGFTASQLWELVRSCGSVALFDSDDLLVDCSTLRWDEVIARSSEMGLRVEGGADLVMFKNVKNIGALVVPSGWRVLGKAAAALVGRRAART